MTTVSTRLTAATPSDREIVITRTFNAPKAQVYEGFTSPALLKHWNGKRQSLHHHYHVQRQEPNRKRINH